MTKRGKGRGIQLHQPVKRTAKGLAPSGSWWLNKTREEFQRAVEAETPRMKGDHMAIWRTAMQEAK